ncbi:Alcohol oxidase [Cladobotryum mycophilum]|uniref:Alcohol oxidase n=1 Tax=Cladobotryum mycophilum TaxID=491253 RepID=A0ABR0S9F5_9HYPO
MAILDDIPAELDGVDVIIAGGGTAGCVIAARLSDANPNLSILVIEGGQNNYNDPSIIHPMLCSSHLMPNSKRSILYQAAKEVSVDNRELNVLSGGILGGGSSINLLTYSRAQRQDLDSWNTPGWSAEELIPYMKKLETYHGPGTAETHGNSGPIHITQGTYCAKRSEREFIQAAAKIGWPEVVDLQNLDTNNAVQRNLRYVGLDGRRQDAAHMYLHPRLQDGNRPNLRVLVEHQVVRIVFKQRKAVGVEYRPNPTFRAGAETRTIVARKMVVVSCGALGTPLLLQRSGVGDREILNRAGVEVIADVPGVGRNYMDHHLHVHPYRSSLLPEETVDAALSGRVNIGELIKTNANILGWNVADVTSKLRPSEADVAALGPAFQTAWNRDFKNHPERPIAIITSMNGFPGDPTSVPAAQYISTSTFTTYPYSRGHIHITGPNQDDTIDFRTGFFSDAENVDIKQAMWAYKKQREILRRMDVYRGEYIPGHPPFPAGSDAACVEINEPLEDVSDILYTPEDDAILEQWLRQTVSTTWHSMGTCKMAPLSELGVVDATLGVYGVEGLKVADLSIPPQNVASNTANTAFVVGEKAADIFIKELAP